MKSEENNNSSDKVAKNIETKGKIKEEELSEEKSIEEKPSEKKAPQEIIEDLRTELDVKLKEKDEAIEQLKKKN